MLVTQRTMAICLYYNFIFVHETTYSINRTLISFIYIFLYIYIFLLYVFMYSYGYTFFFIHFTFVRFLVVACCCLFLYEEVSLFNGQRRSLTGNKKKVIIKIIIIINIKNLARKRIYRFLYTTEFLWRSTTLESESPMYIIYNLYIHTICLLIRQK